jgi:hypothetical protein
MCIYVRLYKYIISIYVGTASSPFFKKENDSNKNNINKVILQKELSIIKDVINTSIDCLADYIYTRDVTSISTNNNNNNKSYNNSNNSSSITNINNSNNSNQLASGLIPRTNPSTRLGHSILTTTGLLFFHGWNVLVIYCWAVLLYLYHLLFVC